ncbi:MAG: hypothetical protein QOE33_3044 [Acidobacteriota bacterium]|nr:hypothetical protein [Acidobacteriota bacterium]
MEPKVFVGSSKESLQFAEYIQRQLQHGVTVRLWTQDVFRPGDYNLERLLEIVGQYDFAVFLVVPDDIAEIRGKRVLIARDNVLFEAGLFFSQLGRRRTILIVPADAEGLDFHLPSDLDGITLVRYYPPSDPDDLPAKLGTACGEIKEVIRTEGILADAMIESVINSLSGGPIYLLRHIVTRSHNLAELTDILMQFNSVISKESNAAWMKATKYAVQTLSALGLIQSHGADEYYVSPLGKRILTSENIKSRFFREINKPLAS